MQVTKNQNHFLLRFNVLEVLVLDHVLGELSKNYHLPPGELDPKTAAAWYSTRGCETARMSAEETREWRENIHALKGANLRSLAEWARELARPQDEGHADQVLAVQLDEAPQFVTMLNDHRLWAAARHDIGETEMNTRSEEAFGRLTDGQQTALLEITFLAEIIERIVHLMLDDEVEDDESNGPTMV